MYARGDNLSTLGELNTTFTKTTPKYCAHLTMTKDNEGNDDSDNKANDGGQW